MRFYHFTARHHLDGGPGHPGPGILKVGLIANHHPLLTLPAHIWLTTDPSWDQLWSTRPVPLPDGTTCDRTEVRLSVEPLDFRGTLSYAAVRPFVRPGWLADFEGGHDLSAWYVQLGWIGPASIVAVDSRPVEAIA